MGSFFALHPKGSAAGIGGPSLIKRDVHKRSSIVALIRSRDVTVTPEYIFVDHQTLETYRSTTVQAILDLDDCIDLIIPRGGNELVQHIMSNTKIPVMGHADGICHVYVDRWADLEKATRIIVDAKTDYPSACNAVETVLVHEKVAGEFLPSLSAALKAQGVALRLDSSSRNIVGEGDAATEEDWATEYLDLVLAIKVVGERDEAIDHINHYGSHHTESIVT